MATETREQFRARYEAEMAAENAAVPGLAELKAARIAEDEYSLNPSPLRRRPAISYEQALVLYPEAARYLAAERRTTR